MASIRIRKLGDAVKAELRISAARSILTDAVAPARPQAENLADAMRRYVEPFGGVELHLAGRKPVRRAPTFGR